MERELQQALTQLEPGDVDSAAVELARVYARALDNDGALDVLGPKLLAVLESLGMTPRSRSAKGGQDATTSPLDELRERRDARVNNA